MTRSILAGLALLIAIPFLWGTGCQATGVGDPCVPEPEYDPTYTGAVLTDTDIESKSYQCQSFLCLVNHFQGRVSCPYGQPNTDAGYAGANPCVTPIGQPIVGTNGDGGVAPNCVNRQRSDAVYCSCRCENVEGQTNDGFNYCTCPDGFTCTQLVSSIGGQSFPGLTGGYCVKNGTAYPDNFICDSCDPAQGNCGTGVQGVSGH
jgi:hypothetical protein